MTTKDRELYIKHIESKIFSSGDIDGEIKEVKITEFTEDCLTGEIIISVGVEFKEKFIYFYVYDAEDLETAVNDLGDQITYYIKNSWQQEEGE